MLAQQLSTVNLRLHHVCESLTPELLTGRVAPAANPVGFLLWHMARSQDWGVNTALRGVDEVARRPPWAGSPLLRTLGMGTGFGPEQVDRIAAELDLEALLGYADAVHAEVLAWLSSIDESALDEVPDVAAHTARFPEYQLRAFVEEMDSGPEHDDAVGRAGGLPAWLLLTSVSVTHLHRHLGEIDLTLGVLTGRAG